MSISMIGFASRTVQMTLSCIYDFPKQGLFAKIFYVKVITECLVIEMFEMLI
jgi:hypothetical protein